MTTMRTGDRPTTSVREGLPISNRMISVNMRISVCRTGLLYQTSKIWISQSAYGVALEPGSRIVNNTFFVDGWEPDVKETIEGDCTSWCTAGLYIVPAKVDGTWRLPQGSLRLDQSFQEVTGTLIVGDRSMPIEQGRLKGREITFTAGGTTYTGKVNGTSMDLNAGGSKLTATKKS